MNREDALKMSDNALQDLAQALKEGKSDKLVEYLGMLSRFHQYSFGNCIMIYMQRPDATYVAGFWRWKELNRFVKKGEKGIAIFAPMVGKRKKESESYESSQTQEDGANRDSKVLFGFRVVHIFDVSQTEGQELPNFAALDGDPGDRIQRLEQIIRNHGIELEFAENLPHGANGMSEGGKISISAKLPKPQMFSTMVHELAHEQLHWGDRRESTSKAVRETEAEAVAYVVCRAVGLECSTRASDYIQLWSGDDKILLQSLELIRTVSSKIIADLESEPVGQETQEVAHVA